MTEEELFIKRELKILETNDSDELSLILILLSFKFGYKTFTLAE